MHILYHTINSTNIHRENKKYAFLLSQLSSRIEYIPSVLEINYENALLFSVCDVVFRPLLTFIRSLAATL